MRLRLFLIIILLNTSMVFNSLAQEMPAVYDVENTGADCPVPYLSAFSELPTIQALPDPFIWSDGRGRIANFSDWRCRRAEISAEVQHYEIGNKPQPPENLTTILIDDTLKITVEDNGKSLTLITLISLPDSGSGPFPAVIGVGFGSGSLPADIFTSRDIATIHYNFGQVAPWTQSGRGQGGFYQLYPDPKVGYFTAWAWGVSRIIDGLQAVAQNQIDTRRLAITGCSFAGKIALFSGALDERIALVIAQEPGGGGDAAWRVTETLSGSRETLRNAQSYGWYHEDVKQFNNAVTKLPFDHHEVMAMIAPRALLVLGNPDMEWLADESGYVGCMAAYEVWKALGVPERFGFSKVGGHFHCQLPNSQRSDVAAFVDKFLLNKDSTDTNIMIHPGYTTSLSTWIPWTTPTLANDSSYFGKPSLILPPDLETDLDTTVTFTWKKVEDAKTYIIQLSTNPTFTAVAFHDSTTDTLKTISGLSEGQMYYWHVQAKNGDGLTGPWSDPWTFATYIPLPETPELISAALTRNTRSDYVTLLWRKVKDASQYRVQLTEDSSFTSILVSSITSDTVVNLKGTKEGGTYYWRVQAKNVAGSSPWSEVLNFTVILPPTGLDAQFSASNEISLSWADNSDVEDGYIIERKQSPQITFEVIDTLAENANHYVDQQVVQGQTCTYRVKAYKGSVSSDYSDEVTVYLTSIKGMEEIPTMYSLSQNYPNPFNASTNIEFALQKPALTKLSIYDLCGRKIRTLLNAGLEMGHHEINVDARDLPSGVYLYRVQSGDFNDTKKMILMK